MGTLKHPAMITEKIQSINKLKHINIIIPYEVEEETIPITAN